ncbi:hypothetical protein EV121DRAFT_255817 [Schizophyllum commune]
MLGFQQQPPANHGVHQLPTHQAPTDDMGQQQQQPPQPVVAHQQQPQPTASQPPPAPTRGRKRKSPPSKDQGQQQPPPPPGAVMTAPMPVPLPPHMIAHLPGPLPPGFVYAPSDFTPGGMPQQQNGASSPEDGSVQLEVQVEVPVDGQQQNRAQGRQLSTSKRAEQNRKAQRAFRERRDQHVKALESRSQLLDAALASADEANRRWEECRTLVDQLRVENAALRAALSQAQMLPPGATIVVGPHDQQQQQQQHPQQQPQDPQSVAQDEQDNDPVIRSQPVREDGEHA